MPAPRTFNVWTMNAFDERVVIQGRFAFTRAGSDLTRHEALAIARNSLKGWGVIAARIDDDGVPAGERTRPLTDVERAAWNARFAPADQRV